MEPGLKGLAFATIGGGIVACDACPGSGDALKPSFAVGDRGCENGIKGLLKKLLIT